MAKYCPNCGNRLPDEAVFCDNCGTRVDLRRPDAGVPVQQSIQGNYRAVPDAPKKKAGGKGVGLLILLFLIVAAGFGIYKYLQGGIGLPDLPVSIPSLLPESGSGNGSDDPGQGTYDPSGEDEAGSQGASQTSQGILSPEGDPSFEDFLFYETDVYKNGIPDDAVLLTAGNISGEWKFCLTFNRGVEWDERIDEIGIAEVSFTSDSASLILHPQMIRYGSSVSPEDEDEVGYPVFTGTWDNEYIDLLGGDISIGLGPFYSYEGKEYVIGNIVARSTGLFGEVLLVRP